LSASVLKVKVLTLVVADLLQVKSTLRLVKPSTYTSVAKAATMAEVPVVQTATAAVHQTSALAEIRSQIVSSLPVVAVVMVAAVQVVTAVPVKLVSMVLLALPEFAQDAAGMLVLVEMAHVLVAEMEVTQAADTQAVAVVQV
jgi:hypothetical protein